MAEQPLFFRYLSRIDRNDCAVVDAHLYLASRRFVLYRVQSFCKAFGICRVSLYGIQCLYQAETGRWETLSPPEGFERNTLFLDEMRHFINIVKGAAIPLCTLEDGVQALRLALAALHSSETRQLVSL